MAVADPCAELEEQLPHEPVINSDETGYRTDGEKRWLWAFVASIFVVYQGSADTRHRSSGADAGFDFRRHLVQRPLSGLFQLPQGVHAAFWAHFKRNILGVQEIAKTADAERFCRDALALHARLFRLWHRFRAGPEVRYGSVTRQQLINKSIPLQKGFFTLADRYLDSSGRDVRDLAKAMFQPCEKFFVFIEKDGVEPTNNSAERALRCAVQWRKTSFGSRSANGEVTMAHLLTVTQTCRMQKRNPLDYLNHAIRSHRLAQQAPSLLKTSRPT